MARKYAFRCKNCGHLMSAGTAGENQFPHACSVCGKGVTHSELHHEIDRALARRDSDGLDKIADKIQNRQIDVNDQTKTVYPSNWEILEEVTPARLKELGLTKDEVEAPPPEAQAAPGEESQKVVGRPFRVFAEEGVSGKEGTKAVKTPHKRG